MIDRTKVIKGLEEHTNLRTDCEDCPYNGQLFCQSVLIEDALKLLKSQPDVVQCGECKYYSNGFCYNPNTYDDVITCGNTSPAWSCADGKRREA